MTKLAVEFAGIKAKNPVFTASGTCGFGRELNEIFPIDFLGHRNFQHDGHLYR